MALFRRFIKGNGRHNWAATLVLHVHKIVGMAVKAQQLTLRNEIHKIFWPKYLRNGAWEQSIFCTQMELNESNKLTEWIFNIHYNCAGMAYKKAFTNFNK